MASALTTAFFSGGKPKIPEYPLVDIAGEQTAAVKENRSSLPGIENLASRVNAFSSAELMKQLEKALPGYGALLAKGTETIGSQLRGEIPEDVSRAISQATAERSRAGGYAGSEVGRNLTARDLGLTSLDITNRGLASAERWLAQAQSRAPLFDFTSMFVTPAQRISVKLQENANVFNRNLLKARIDALPSPAEAAAGQFFDTIEETGRSVLMMYAGGQMGGMGGMGGGGGGGSVKPNRTFDVGGGYVGSQGLSPGASEGGSFYNDTSGTYDMNSGVQSYDLPSQYNQPEFDPYFS